MKPDEQFLRQQTATDEEYWEKWKQVEGKNQRFLIHIVPVIGNIDVTKAKIRSIKRTTK